MSLYLGPLYFEEKDIYTILALLLLIGGWFFGLWLPLVSYPTLILLIFLFLIAKGLTIKTHENLVYIIFLTAFILSTFLDITIVVLYALLSFLFCRFLKMI